jgi:3-hydroxybutyryl-CoA dehydrogenase
MTTILVIGAGVMGHGIAQAFAQRNIAVRLVDSERSALERAKELIAASLETLWEEKFIDLSVSEALTNITFSQSLEESADDVDIAIEAISETVEAKKMIFSRLDKACPSKTILCSNTSYLNIFEFVETGRPDKVLITHWYSPSQLIPLIEVVGGPETSAESVNRVLESLREIGTKPIYMKKYISGYAINRIQHAFNREVHYLLDNGYISPEQLDEAARAGLAVRMMVLGVVARIDFSGVSMRTRHPPGFEEVPLDYEYKTLKRLIEKGRLGVKAGRGFYDYSDRPAEATYRERDIRLVHMLRALEELEARGPIAGRSYLEEAQSQEES